MDAAFSQDEFDSVSLDAKLEQARMQGILLADYVAEEWPGWSIDTIVVRKAPPGTNANSYSARMSLKRGDAIALLAAVAATPHQALMDCVTCDGEDAWYVPRSAADQDHSKDVLSVDSDPPPF